MSVNKKEIEAFRKQQQELIDSGSRQLWKSVEERNADPALVKKNRVDEFSQLKPQASSEDSEPKFNRRAFLQWFGAASALMTGTACQRRSRDTLVPYVDKPENMVYGVPTWYASSSADGLGLLVKTREGRPIKLEGNPDHPMSQGGLDVQAQASILNLYNPERLRHPVEVATGSEVSWEKLDSDIRNALSEARPGAVRVLTETLYSPTLKSQIEAFKNHYGAKHYVMESSPVDPIARAYEIVADQRRIPVMNFEQADVVLSLDADFLGTWLRPVEFTKQFSKRRALHDDDINVNRLFSFESHFTITGVASDHRFRIKPSQQLRILLSFAKEFSKRTSVEDSVSEFLEPFSLESMAQELGVSESSLRECSDALWSARGKALVVSGGHGPDSLAVQLATILLNSMLNSYGSTIDWQRSLKVEDSSAIEFDELVRDALDDKVDVLIIQGSNPVYSRPDTDFEYALSKVKKVVTISPDFHETARKADYAVGESHFLESWGDCEVYEGVVSVQQPSIEPIFKTRSFGEVLSHWTEEEPGDYRQRVRQFWRDHYYSEGGFESWWHEVLREGVTTYQSESHEPFSPRWSGAVATWEDAVNHGEDKDASLELVAYESIALRDGKYANNAWLQELPDSVSKVTWGNFAAVSPKLANQQELHQNEVIQIQVGERSIELPVFVQPGLRDDVVAVALGYGRQYAGTIGSEVGENAYTFTQKGRNGEFQLSGFQINISKTGKRYELASTQSTFDLHGRDKDILHQTTLSKFREDPTAAKEPLAHGTKSIYNETDHLYPGHKWGMSIDLNKCTGCQACVVACYSENNVPVVGPDQVRRHRHMGWIRLDLYYTGSEDEPEAAFEPMLCQHCDKAPCETVCPVLATAQSSDGLNDMTYNRCVGTRYCANNCPYKVRRFNYFQYSDALAGKMEVEGPLPMMLNPDVTVRSRGVMEKCTFCVQRIRQTTQAQKNEGTTRVPDGSIETACQQSCPADAISFGDLNDPNSKVSKLSQRAQGFKVLEMLNTRPAVTYLPRIRNKGDA